MNDRTDKNNADARPMTPLAEEIRRKIRQSGRTGRADDGQQVACIPFRDYMSLCLYHPKYGYYVGGPVRTGRSGDFYTSVFIGDIMGEVLAERIAGMAEKRFADAGRVDVIDYGGGTGRLSVQMLDRWAAMGSAGERFRLTLVDSNPAHLMEAGARLETYIRKGQARILTSEAAEAENWKGRPVVVAANELLDAFPVVRVICKGGRLWEQGVYEDDGGRFSFCLMEMTEPDAGRWLAEQKVHLREGQKTEIGLEAAKWIAGLGSRFDEAVLILADYGDSTSELTAEHRMDGTLLCYERHTARSDPFVNPGSQDITAHVDFDLIRRYALEAGWKLLWYGTQKDYLIQSGIMGKLAAHAVSDPFHPLARRNRAIRQLLLSDGMSELFKVQIFAR